MMFKKINKISDVLNYSILYENISYIRGNDNIMYLNHSESKGIGRGRCTFYLLDGEILLNKGSFFYRFDCVNISIEKLKYNIKFINDSHIIEYSEGFYNYLLSNYNIDFNSIYRFSIIFERKIGIYEIENDEFEVSKLAGISIDGDSLIWEYDVSEALPINRYDNEKEYAETLVGIVGGKLWIYTRGGRLVALVVATGEVLKLFSDFKEDEKYGFTIHNGLGDIFRKEGDDDYLYCLGVVNQKIDVHTMEIVENFDYEKDEELQQFSTILHHKLQGDYFTFHAMLPKESSPRYAGIYDYNNRKLVWLEEIITKEEYKKNR